MSVDRSIDGWLHIALIALAVIDLFSVLMMVFAFPMTGMRGWRRGGAGGELSPLWGIGMLLV